MIASGCEDINKVPIPEDRICPKCGRDIEVFVVKGRVWEDAVCECGYVIKAQDQIQINSRKVEDRGEER